MQVYCKILALVYMKDNADRIMTTLMKIKLGACFSLCAVSSNSISLITDKVRKRFPLKYLFTGEYV